MSHERMPQHATLLHETNYYDSAPLGLLDLDEFVTGCMQLHGPAKSLQADQGEQSSDVVRWRVLCCVSPSIPKVLPFQRNVRPVRLKVFC